MNRSRTPWETRLWMVALLGLGTMSSIAAADNSTPLFNGRDLEGWQVATASPENPLPDSGTHWTVDNGELVHDGRGPALSTRRDDLADFELTLEVRADPGTEAVLDLRGAHRLRLPAAAAGASAWKTVQARLIGSRAWLWLDGQCLVDGDLPPRAANPDPAARSGRLGLESSGGSSRWRRIALREIGADEANRLLGEHRRDGYRSIFNGKDFNGWQGDMDQYEIIDGAIVSKAGGNIFTQDLFADFSWRLEFKLPPGGNNGLAIRYPGKGNPAYSGMCELQVLDNTAEKYADLDPRQYHGSIYGKVPARRGHLRPPGEWNVQEVKVHGSRITVELNGTVILDADLSTVTEFMDPKFTAHIPPSGHLGFAGHGKGVAFRHLHVKEEKDQK